HTVQVVGSIPTTPTKFDQRFHDIYAGEVFAVSLQVTVGVGRVTGRRALCERLATVAGVDARDRAVVGDVPLRVRAMARQTRGLARALDALLGQVTGRAVVERGIEAVRSRVDEVRADVDRALEFEAERDVATSARGAVGVRV